MLHLLARSHLDPFHWREAALCVPGMPPLVVCMALGGQPTSGAIAAGTAFSVGFGAAREMASRRWAAMLLAMLWMTVAAFAGTLLGRQEAMFVVVAAALAATCAALALAVHALYYDNRGDPTAVDADLQWGWRTRFVEAGALVRVGPHTQVIAQAMTGSTKMGYPIAGRLWIDTHFDAAFALLSQDLGRATLSGRVEAFGTDGRGSVADAEYGERGWASTVAVKRPIDSHCAVLLEGLHIDSTHGNRPDARVAARQRQNVVQLALRLHS